MLMGPRHALPLPVYVLAQVRGVGWHGGQARSASLCPSNPHEMGDHARCARVCWRRPKSHRFAGVIVEDLGRNLAGGQYPTHLCRHATRFLHTKAETYGSRFAQTRRRWCIALCFSVRWLLSRLRHENARQIELDRDPTVSERALGPATRSSAVQKLGPVYIKFRLLTARLFINH